VVAYINFAGGAGGNPEKSPGQSCEPQALTALYGDFGRHTVLPNLWLYAENDQYWGPDEPVAWHQAFAAGGSPRALSMRRGAGWRWPRPEPSPGRLWAAALDAFCKACRRWPGIGQVSPARRERKRSGHVVPAWMGLIFIKH
jgi:hypothetical protein